jgi:hypothetical protein
MRIAGGIPSGEARRLVALGCAQGRLVLLYTVQKAISAIVIRPTLLLIKIVAARANCHDFAACLTFYLSSQTVR